MCLGPDFDICLFRTGLYRTSAATTYSGLGNLLMNQDDIRDALLILNFDTFAIYPYVSGLSALVIHVC